MSRATANGVRTGVLMHAPCRGSSGRDARPHLCFDWQRRLGALVAARSFVAEPGDCVLIAGRGHEQTQVIGTKKIDFDDRVVAREVLQFAKAGKLLS